MFITMQKSMPVAAAAFKQRILYALLNMSEFGGDRLRNPAEAQIIELLRPIIVVLGGFYISLVLTSIHI
jgi:hypothetical protein